MIGEGEVITGLEQGVEGMQVGEKRKIKIPSALGYGKRATGKIPANATLVFQVELNSIGEATARDDEDEDGSAGGDDAGDDYAAGGEDDE